MGGVIYAEANKKHLLEIKQDVEASSGVVFDLKKKKEGTQEQLLQLLRLF